MNIQVKQNDLTIGSFTLTPTGMITQGMPKFDEWVKCGDFIQKANKSVHFWLGDWLNFGEGAYGEEFAQEIDEVKFKYQTLQNDKWVAKRIAPSRRRESISFSHHAEVADLEPDEQEEMLTLAVEKNLPLSQFRKTVRHFKLKLDAPELSDEQLKPTDPKVFEDVQKVIDSSIATVEMLENMNIEVLDPSARDWLISHLKRAGTFYFSLVKKYEQKPLSG
jgi:hypothetical protein